MKLLGQILFPIFILFLGYVGFGALKKSKPEPKSKKAQVVIPLVNVLEVSPADHAAQVLSFGTVQSYFETTLTPQVTGEIISVSESFRVGMMVEKGAVLARIDDTDYQATLAALKADKVNAQQVLAEEEINVRQAAADWTDSGRKISDASDFVLRKPQLAAATANVQSAEAAEAKARVDIERSVIRAPYDAMVLARTASLGNLANQQQPLGRLVAVSKAEVRLPLTAVQLSRIAVSRLSSGGAPIDITLTSAADDAVQWPAQLVRVEAAVDQVNQVTYAIAEIDTPYKGHDKPLTIGTFVNVSIPANPIKNAYSVNESALVNDAFVWVINADGKLKKLAAKRMQSSEGSVFLNIEREDLTPPLRIATRPLTNFKNGDKVKAAVIAE